MEHWQGRWVKFADTRGFFPGAHHARDGRVVGIYCIGPTVLKDGKKIRFPDYVMVCNSLGENLVIEIHGVPQEARVAVDGLVNLCGINDRRDIPAARLRNVPEDWQPRG